MDAELKARFTAVLADAVRQMEHDAEGIDGEWGDCRKVAELYAAGEMPAALTAAVALLAELTA